MKKIFLTSFAAILFLASAHAQNPWTGNELRLNGKAQTKVKRIQNPMTGVIFYRLSDSTVCVRNPNNSVVELGPGGGYLPDSLELDHYTLSIIGSNSVNLLHDSLVLSNDTLSILNSNSVVLPTDYSPWDTSGTDIVQKDTALNVVVNNKLTADSLVFTGASVGNGTAANPAIYFANSSGVGFYRSASNVLGIATAGTQRVTIDAQGDINVAGGRGVNSVADADMWATFMPTDAQQALTDTGAANVTSYYTALTTTVASPVTLASGTQIGQLKKITLVVDAADATLTLTGYTSIVFNDAGDYVLLLWNGSAWFATENSGCTITP